MRYLLIVFLFLGNASVFAQSESSISAYITVDSRFDIYDTKWYLNAVRLDNFYWNDTSSLITSMPYDNKFIRIGKKLEYGQDRDPKDFTKNILVNYRLNFTDYDDADNSQFEGYITTYKSRRNARKYKHPISYYDFTLTNYQLILTESSPEMLNPVENLYYVKTFVFSRTIDSLEFTTNLLGNWKPEELQNLLLMDNSDTLTLTKVPTISMFNPGLTYHFALNGGYPVCTGDCFTLPDPDYVWKSYYQTTEYEYALDIEKRQLIIFSQSNTEEPDKVFDIITLTPNQLMLTLHLEDKNIMGPAK